MRRSGRIQPQARHLTLEGDVFALSCHPSERLLAVGESSGRVSVWGWPEPTKSDSEDQAQENSEDEDNNEGGDVKEKVKSILDETWFEKKWSTRRHKGSTRCIAFSGDGERKFPSLLALVPELTLVF